MPTLTETFTNAIGAPCTGYVRIEPTAIRQSFINFGDENAVGQERIMLFLDADGSIAADIEPGDYRIDICLTNAQVTHVSVTIPATDGDVPLFSLIADLLPTVDATQITTSGGWSYSIPFWATSIDYALLGAGEAGGSGPVIPGTGGSAGGWQTGTLVRGTDIPWSTGTLIGVVGAGGASVGAPGGNTTLTAVGMGTITATGGSGLFTGHIEGQGAGSRTVNGITYTGGGATETIIGVGTAGKPGNPPGGGGSAAWLTVPFGPGANGSLWLRSFR